MIRNLFFSVLLSAITISAFALDTTPVKVKWGYVGKTGPAHWGQLDPEFHLCATGKTQSPIDVPAQTRISTNALTLHYHAAPMMIVEDGTTNLLIDGEQTLVNTGHSTQLNFPAETKESIEFAGITYRLVQFHFHVPAESQLQGRTFPMEIHFVHQSSDGKLAALGVLVEEGQAHPAIQNIVEHIPTVKGQEQTIQNERINPLDLLPVKHAYYSFAGSLTTPPCVEGLQWVLMADTITASSVQMAALKKAAGGANARPVQALNGRAIELSK